jgi:hypothetical protein
VRILVEDSKATPEKFLSVAENGLQTRSSSCPKPYARVGLQQQSIAGRDGAVLEYTCGSGSEARHGMWGAVIEGGKAYSFYLTTTEATFADSKPIFDEMLKTYKLS